MKNVIEIKNLKKSYKDNFELGPINLNIPSDLIIGLIGENGAGKTTLLKSILNVVKINEGSIKIFNKDFKKEENIIKEEIGVVLDNTFFPELLSPNDINIIMKGIYKNFDSNLFFKYLKDFNLNSKTIIKEMSKGMRKKLEIITALSHHPKLLILDEPTSGLDPVVRDEILELFQTFINDEEHSIIFSTHITSDLEKIADKIIFIDNGKVLLEDECQEILNNYGILKCSLEEFDKIDKDDIISYKKNKYNCEILINNRSKLKKKYKDFIVDKVTLEELMVLMIKGVKEC